MKRLFRSSICICFLSFSIYNGYSQPNLLADLRSGQAVSASAAKAPVSVASSPTAIRPAGRKNPGELTKYEQTCAARFFEFCDYLLSPPDIVIDSASYSVAQKKEEIVMQRERAEDTAKIKKAVLRYTVVPVPTDTTDSLHFSPSELSDQQYRKLENAFSTIERLLDTCYNAGGTALKLVPLRLHDNASIRSQVGTRELPGTFLLRRGKQTLAVLLFTPRNRMTPTSPPRICGWSVGSTHGRMIFHRIAPGTEPVAINR